MDTILSQLKQVTNNYITKNINTGDKIIDVAISVIILAIFDMISKYLISFFSDFSFGKKIGKHPWDFDPLKVKKISEDDLKKYKYCVNTAYYTSLRNNSADQYFYDLIHNWIDENFGEKCTRQHAVKCCLKFDQSSNAPIDVDITTKNIKKIIINVNRLERQHIFMPIWAYKDQNKIEYIYICNNILWSNSIEELNKLIKIVSNCSYDKAIQLSNVSTETKYKDLEIVELTESWKDDKKDFSRSYKNVGYVNKNKTFDKIFFDEKDKLLEMIHKYQNKTLYPSGLGLDNKLGILLYGPPGTGKTGTIFCVANLLKKPVLLINSLKVKKSTIISAVNDVKKTHIIVLDEFDHLLQELKINETVTHGFFSECHPMAIALMAKQKQLEEKYKKNQNNSENSESTEKLEDKNKKSEKSSESTYKDLPDDVFMYKLLDSFGDDDDRLIIATTNNPNMVNPVLLRPGRFDMKLCLTYCSLNMFKNIAQKVFDVNTYLENPENLEKVNKILELNITPLILINTLVLSKSLEECIEKLSKQKQKFYDKKPEEES